MALQGKPCVYLFFLEPFPCGVASIPDLIPLISSIIAESLASMALCTVDWGGWTPILSLISSSLLQERVRRAALDGRGAFCTCRKE